MHFLSYLQMFASYWSATILYFFPGIISYKSFALIIAVLSALVLANRIVRRNFVLERTTFYVACASLLLIFLYRVTATRYGTSNSVYNSFFLVIAGQLAPGIITATFVAHEPQTQRQIKRLAPIIAGIFTYIALMGALFPTSSTSGGFVDNDNGLNYQNTSYIAAYTSALWEYVLITRDQAFHFSFFRKAIGKMVIWFAIFVNLFVVLITGGRGGFVTFVAFAVLSIFVSLRMNKMTTGYVARAAGASAAILLAALIVVRNVKNTSIQTSGFSRIVGLLSGAGDSGRATLREAALRIFSDHPIFGAGLGSIFYEMGIYSHNLFTDVLAEAGLVGLILLVGLIGYGTKKGLAMVKEDITDLIWLYLFACGFIMTMFSGYWLGNFMMWWLLIFLISHKVS